MKSFNDILSSVNKFIMSKSVITIIVFIILAWFLMQYSDSKNIFDGYEPIPNQDRIYNISPSSVGGGGDAGGVVGGGFSPILPDVSPSVSGNTISSSSSPTVNPLDLLPQDSNSAWGNFNQPVQGGMNAPDLLQAGHNMGLNMVQQALKNANLQLRSDPIIEKKIVSPWMMSTIEPDMARVPLEVGYAPN